MLFFTDRKVKYEGCSLSLTLRMNVSVGFFVNKDIWSILADFGEEQCNDKEKPVQCCRESNNVLPYMYGWRHCRETGSGSNYKGVFIKR